MIATLLDERTIALADAYKQRAACAALDGARWNPVLKCWLADATASNVASIAALCPLPDELAALLPRVEQRVVEDTGQWLTDATPYAHQRHAVAAAMEAMNDGGGFALLMEMGCGKTLTALEIASRLHAAGTVRRVLVVAPSAVVPVWAREVAQYMRTGYEVAQLLGTKKQRLDALASLGSKYRERDPACNFGIMPPFFAVINYESAWRLADELIAWKPDLVIADESQRIKGHSSKQTKGVTRIGTQARYRLALSGTPVTNSPLDVFAQWRFLDRSIFGDKFYPFRARYAIVEQVTRRDGPAFPKVVGYRALDELTEKAHRIAYRVSKADALDLPPIIDTVVPVVLGDKAARAYRDLERDSVAAFDGGETSVTNVLTRLLRLQQCAGGMVPRDDGEIEHLGTEKLDAAIEVIEDAVSQGGKVVVFARFRADVDALVRHFGESAEALHGDVAQDARGEAVRRFQEDDAVRVMVAQLQVGGAGITLTAASTMVFVSLSFNYADYEQAKARIHRIGQTLPCTYVHIVAQGTVDETIIEALGRKRSLADYIVDRGRGIYGRSEK